MKSVVELDLIRQLQVNEPTLHKPSSMQLLRNKVAPKSPGPQFQQKLVMNNKGLLKMMDNERYKVKTVKIEKKEAGTGQKGTSLPRQHGSSMLGQLNISDAGY